MRLHVDQFKKEEGYSVRAIGTRLNIPRATVHYSLKCFKERKSHKQFKSSGRPRATTSKIDKLMIDMIDESDKPNACDVANKLSQLNLAHISPQTVRRRLNESDLHGRATQKKPLLTKKHVKSRLEFGLKHQSWTVDDWKKVLCSDETKIKKMGSDGRVWTRKRTGEALKQKHVKQTVKHDSSIMAWRCFNSTDGGDTHVEEGIMNVRMYIRILSSHMIPSASRLFESEYIFVFLKFLLINMMNYFFVYSVNVCWRLTIQILYIMFHNNLLFSLKFQKTSCPTLFDRHCNFFIVLRLSIDCLKNLIISIDNKPLLDYYNSQKLWTILGEELNVVNGYQIAAK